MAPGTTCQVLLPASVKGPPSGSVPAGRLSSKAASPRGGASRIDVPTTPMAGGPWMASLAAGFTVLVPVTVWYITTTVSATRTGSAYARQP
ncbi:hypothetical protein [Mycobacterium sp.]|uniref:hypothetical protein n=1 Tax=Mycobacterium sp. TaxID=1785 RepID=UPI003F94A14E